MSKFNVGDRVRRIDNNFGMAKVGKEYVVSDIYSSEEIGFKKDPWKYSPKYFELVEPALTIDKVTEWLSENGYKFSIHKDKVNGADFWSSEDFLNGCLEITTHEEPEFEWGEEVEVRDNNLEPWKEFNIKTFFFVGKNHKSDEYPYIVSDENGSVDAFKYCRKLKTKVTLDEIAEWKGVDKDRIEIE